MDRTTAEEFVRANAGIDKTPTLTEEELADVITRSRIIDSEGRLITDPDYIETIWGTRAVLLALDVRVAKVITKVDVQAGDVKYQGSQLVAQLRSLRASWAARLIPGSE